MFPRFFSALAFNAAFSGACALVMISIPALVVGWLGWGEPGVILAVGLALLIFSIRLAIAAWLGTMPEAEARIVIGGDFAWFVGSGVLVAGFLARFSATGIALLSGIALIVLAFALVQLRALRRPARLSEA